MEMKCGQSMKVMREEVMECDGHGGQRLDEDIMRRWLKR